MHKNEISTCNLLELLDLLFILYEKFFVNCYKESKNMFETEEVISLSIGVVFFLYITFFVTTPEKIYKSFWYLGVIFIMLSKVFTIAESVILPQTFDYSEHISIFFGCTCFLISALKKEF